MISRMAVSKSTGLYLFVIAEMMLVLTAQQNISNSNKIAHSLSFSCPLLTSQVATLQITIFWIEIKVAHT